MDYPSSTPATATSLNKYQWDLIHYPNKDWFSWLEDEEEGASFKSASIVCVSSVPKYYGTTFLNPAGKPIDIGNATPYAFFSNNDSEEKLRGTLARFIKDGELYTTYYNKLTNTFEGYAPKASYKTRSDYDKAVYTPAEGNIADAQVFMGSPLTCEYDILKNGKSILGSTKGKLSSCACDDKTDKEYIEGVRKDLIFSKLNWHDGAIANQSYLIKYISPSGQPLEIPSDWRVLVLNESSSEPYKPMTDAIYGFEDKSNKKVYVADIENKEFKGYFDDKGNPYTYKLTGAKHTNPGICTGIELAHFHFYLYNNGTKGIYDMYYCKDLTTNIDMTGAGSVLPAITYCYNECETKAFCQQDKINITFTTLFNTNIDYKYNVYGDGGSLYTYKEGNHTFYIYANKDSKGKWYYYKYNENKPSCCEKWEKFNFPYPDLNEQVQLVIDKTGHTAIDVIGFAPLVGEIADLANGTWYLFEGEKDEAALCYSSMLPVVGDAVVKGGKYSVKAFKSIKKAVEVASEIEMGADASKAFVRIGKSLNAKSLTNLNECLYETGVLLTRHPDNVANIEKLVTSLPTDKLNTILKKLNSLETAKRTDFLTDVVKVDGRITPANNLLANNLDKIDEGIIDTWAVLEGSPLIRLEIGNLQNLKTVIKNSNYSFTADQLTALGANIKKSGSQKRLIEQLKYATKYTNDYKESKDLVDFANIGPISSLRAKPGTNGKTVIIGRNMKYVRVYADELKAQGKEIKIFDGDEISIKARDELREAIENKVTLDKTSELYKDNEACISRLKAEGFEIQDIGNPNNVVEASIFYDMEKRIVFE
jgi:hypothetical protein